MRSLKWIGFDIHKIILLIICSILMLSLMGCLGDQSTNSDLSDANSVVGKWYSKDRYLDVRSDYTYRLQYDYGTGSWKQLENGKYEFYDFYGMVTDVTLGSDEYGAYILFGRQDNVTNRFYKDAYPQQIETQTDENDDENNNAGTNNNGNTTNNGNTNNDKTDGTDDNNGTEPEVEDPPFDEEIKDSVGLSFEMTNDGYTFVGIGSCTDTNHIVIPEKPSDYNDKTVTQVDITALQAEYVTIPSTVTSFTFGGWNTWPELKAINFLGTLEDWCKITFEYGSNPCADGAVLYIQGEKIDGDFSIPDSVDNISDYAFYKYKYFTSLTVEAASIGVGSFSRCEGVTNVKVSSISIGESAFCSCTSLTSVDIDPSVESIGKYAFESCSNLSEINISDSVRYIDKYSFVSTQYIQNNENWENGILYIGNYVLDTKPDVIDVSLRDGTVGICSDAFDNADYMSSLHIPTSLKWIGESAFDYCDSLSSISYSGDNSDWSAITIDDDNSCLTSTLVYNSETKMPVNQKMLVYNGHTYTVFSLKSIKTWDEAKVFCESLGGYLATLTTAEENAAVYAHVIEMGYSYRDVYFGLSDAESEGSWKWVTGEPFEMNSWGQGEPNNYEDGENYATFSWESAEYGYSFGFWNDNDGNMKGWESGAFICEWGEYSTSKTIDYEVFQADLYSSNFVERASDGT